MILRGSSHHTKRSIFIFFIFFLMEIRSECHMTNRGDDQLWKVPMSVLERPVGVGNEVHRESYRSESYNPKHLWQNPSWFILRNMLRAWQIATARLVLQSFIKETVRNFKILYIIKSNTPVPRMHHIPIQESNMHIEHSLYLIVRIRLWFWCSRWYSRRVSDTWRYPFFRGIEKE
jgi:hypothetical protein